jgi:release factor glutamine methyltransferase
MQSKKQCRLYNNTSYANIYKPAEDTFLLADALSDARGDNALEIGTGSGYIAGILARNFKNVVATDIDAKALLYAKSNYNMDNISYICCDAADAIVGMRFDLIAINPPYMPSDSIKDRSIDGGNGGIEVAISMLKSASRLLADHGNIYMVISSLSDYSRLISFIKDKLGLDALIIMKRAYWFEELFVIKISNR